MAEMAKSNDHQNVRPVLTDAEWERFFTLLEKLVSNGQAWQDKKAELHAEAAAHGVETELEEFMSWTQ